MKKLCTKAMSIILCLCLSVVMCSCQFLKDAISSLDEDSTGMVEDTSLGYTKVSQVTFSSSPYYTPVKSTQSYDMLETKSMKALYEKLYTHIHYVYPQANEQGEYKTKQVIMDDILMDEADIRLTIKALTDDNPQVFWLSDTFGFLTNTGKNYTAVQLYSRLSPTQLDKAVSELKTSVDSFLGTLRDGLSQYELELMIYNYILASCSYDKSIEVDESGFPKTNTNAFDTYGAIVEKTAVCEGYSRTFQLLCNLVGIKCVNIIGQSQGELHMWNAVEIEGENYFVDTTWGDSDEKAQKYDYLNINETQLKENHEFSKLASEMTQEEICGDGKLNALTSNFYIPKCTDTEYNYYVKSTSGLSDFAGEGVIDELLLVAKEKEDFFHIYINPDSFNYDYAVDQLFFSQPQYFFNYTDAVNAQLADYSIDVNNMTIYQKEHLNVVTIVMKYV